MRNKLLNLLTILITFTFPVSMYAAEKIYIYNWTEYIPETVLQQFTEETGIKVIYSTYESNEAMYAKLKLINSEGYDLVFPSTYFVSKMAKEGMLQPLDHTLLNNIVDLDPTLMNKKYDKDNTYSLPYMWGSTGIGVNAESVDVTAVTAWVDLWDPKYKNQVLLQDDMREVFHMALKIKGYSTNSTNPVEIEEAYTLLKDLMPNVLLFNSDSPRIPFLAGEVSIGMLWNGEAWMAELENPSMTYIYPSEGANFWIDSFAIPKNAKNIANAHRFINFMLRADIAKICVEENGYATPVLSALPLLEDTVRNSTTIFPPAEIVQKGEFQADVGDALPLYQKYWEKLRSSN